MLIKMKTVWKVALSVVALGAIGVSHVEHVQAQQVIPPYVRAAIVFGGAVTINGQAPTHDGFTITARIGDVYESQPAIVAVSTTGSFRYEHLIVAPSLVGFLPWRELMGSQVEFWINGEVKSTVTNWYAILEPCPESSSLCPTSDYWDIFAISREVDLDFPSLPDPEPIPAVNPTPLPTAELVPTMVATPDIGKLRVGGSAIPPTFALIAILTGSALVLFGFVAFSRRDRVRKQE